MLDLTLMTNQVKQDMQNLVQQNMSRDEDGNDVLTESGANNISSNSLHTLWSSICSYVSQNSMVTASWVAVNPTSGVPDPVVVMTGKINAIEGPGLQQAPLKPCQDAVSALSALSLQLNTLMMTWMVTWDDPTLLVSPVNLILPGIVLIPLGEGGDGLRDICDKILGAVKDTLRYTPTFAGSHAAFTGSGALTSIV
jgi:hypothetical protein